MSVILVDLGEDKHDVMVSNAGWRDTVELMRSFGVLGAQRLQLLETAWLGQQLTQEEAQAIGNALVAGPLSSINWSDNVYPSEAFWVDPGRHSQDFDLTTYWPSWLRAFAGFCLCCKGFVIH